MKTLKFTFLLQNLLHVLDTFSNAKQRMLEASKATAKLAQESSTTTLISLKVEVTKRMKLLSG